MLCLALSLTITSGSGARSQLWAAALTEDGRLASKPSLLLNQTAVMTSETYLRDALAAVTAEQLASMRAAVRPYLTRLSYHGGAELDRGMDALDLTVEHMLRREKGYPEMTSTRIPEALRPARAGWPGPTALSA